MNYLDYNDNAVANLKKYRKEALLSVEELSKKSGVPFHTLLAYEKEVHGIGFKNLMKLADYFNVALDEFLGRELKVKK